MFNGQFDKIHPYTNVSSASLLLVHEHMALPYSPYLSLKEFHGVKLRLEAEAHSRIYIRLLVSSTIFLVNANARLTRTVLACCFCDVC